MNPDTRGVWMMFSTVSHGNMWNTVELEKDETLFGRSEEECDIVVPLSFVSAKHFLIRKKQDRYYVMDCDSMAGTWLNNEKVSGEILLKEKIEELEKEEGKLNKKEEEVKKLEESNREKISSDASPEELIEIANKLKEASLPVNFMKVQNVKTLKNILSVLS